MINLKSRFLDIEAFATISIVLYVVALSTPVLILYDTQCDACGGVTDKIYGIRALLLGFTDEATILPWSSNILYFLVLAFLKILPKYLTIALMISALVLGFLLLSFDLYERHLLKSKWVERPEISIGFYFWIGSYVVLLLGLAKEHLTRR